MMSSGIDATASITVPCSSRCATRRSASSWVRRALHRVMRIVAGPHRQSAAIAQNQKTLTDAFFNDPTGTDFSKIFATKLKLNCKP